MTSYEDHRDAAERLMASAETGGGYFAGAQGILLAALTHAVLSLVAQAEQAGARRTG
jgi:hypothetical protein